MSGRDTSVELVVFVGLQGAGKSTWYRQHFAATHAHVSKDLMRSNRNKERRQRELIEGALREGIPVVVDNTNPSPDVRAPLIAIGRAHGARVVAVFFDVPLALCEERNRRREGRARVPDVALHVTHARLVPPTEAEGFDEVRVVRTEPDPGHAVGPSGAGRL